MRNRLRYRERHMACDLRKPALLFRDCGGVPVSAGDSDEQIIAQSKTAVVPSARHQLADGKMTPLRKLCRHQSPDERLIDHHAGQSLARRPRRGRGG